VGNLLTGQLFISLDIEPKAAKAKDYDPNARPLQIPTIPGSFDKLQEQMAEIVDKLNKIPFDAIGNNLNHTLADLDGTIKQLNGDLLPAFKQTLKGANQTLGTANNALSADSPLQQNLNSTMQELQRMARSLRVLTDYLNAQPSSLIRGRTKDAPPTSTATPSTAQPQQGSKP
jgi:paraquat-inducible protein B